MVRRPVKGTKVTQEIGIGTVSLGWMGQLHTRAYRRLFDHYPDAGSEPLCRGFAIGRSIYGEPARRWLAGEINDDELVSTVADRYAHMNALWQSRDEQNGREDAAG